MKKKRFYIITSMFVFLAICAVGSWSYMYKKNNIKREKLHNQENRKQYRKIDSLMTYSFDLAELEVGKLYGKAMDDNDSVRLAYAYVYKAVIDREKNKPDSILFYLNTALGLAIPMQKEEDLKARANYEKAAYYYTFEKEYAKSIEYLLSIKEYYEEREQGLAQIYNSMGNVYSNLEDAGQALAFYKRAYDIFEKQGDSINKAMYFVNVARVLIYQSKHSEAREKLKTSLKAFRKTNDTIKVIYVLKLLSDNELLSGKLTESFKYIDQAYSLAKLYGDKDIEGRVFLTYGNIYKEKEDYEKALDYYLEGQQRIKRPDFRTLKAISDIYFKTDRPLEAYDYLKKYYDLKYSIGGENVKAKIATLQYENRFQRYKYEKEIKEQSYKKKLYVYLVVIVSVFSLAMFFWFLYRNKSKSLYIVKMENSGLEERMKAEQKVQKLQIEQFESELKSKKELRDLEKQQYEFEKKANHKLQLLQSRQKDLELEANNRRLTSINLLLLSKNELLNEIEEILKGKEDRNKVFAKLEDSIRSNRKQEKEWERFRETFTKIYPLFLKTLRFRYPSLSKTEVRICMYIKMEMSKEEITELLNINHQSLIRTRYHIRKKMNLQRAESLDKIIQNL